MEIQQHDGVVVDVAGLRQGFAELLRERERCCRGGGRRPRLRCCCPPFPPLYIGPRERGGAALPLPSRKGAARGESFPPKAPRRCLPPLGLSLFSYLLRMGLLGLVPLAHIGQGAPLTAHVAPRGWWTPLVDPRTPFGTPGTIPIKCETFPATKIRLPIYKSLPPDHSGTSRDVRDLIRDSEQLSGFRIHISLQP